MGRCPEVVLFLLTGSAFQQAESQAEITMRNFTVYCEDTGCLPSNVLFVLVHICGALILQDMDKSAKLIRLMWDYAKALFGPTEVSSVNATFAKQSSQMGDDLQRAKVSSPAQDQGPLSFSNAPISVPMRPVCLQACGIMPSFEMEVWQVSWSTLMFNGRLEKPS